MHIWHRETKLENFCGILGLRKKVVYFMCLCSRCDRPVTVCDEMEPDVICIQQRSPLFLTHFLWVGSAHHAKPGVRQGCAGFNPCNALIPWPSARGGRAACCGCWGHSCPCRAELAPGLPSVTAPLATQAVRWNQCMSSNGAME